MADNIGGYFWPHRVVAVTAVHILNVNSVGIIVDNAHITG